jgi:hypothetical protein
MLQRSLRVQPEVLLHPKGPLLVGGRDGNEVTHFPRRFAIAYDFNPGLRAVEPSYKTAKNCARFARAVTFIKL